MKIGIIIPDRNDRPKLLKNSLRMLKAQTLKPYCIALVNGKPISDKPDITWRYRTGYDILRKKGLDIIAFWENDDWYSPDYLRYMTDKWVEHGKPDLFGTNHSIYYNIKLKKYFEMLHDQRSPAMNTFIKPDMNFEWCPDYETYTDLHLFKTLKLNYKVFRPERLYTLGIKHGVGKLGGRSHIDRLHRYKIEDNGFLKRTLDPISYNFYWNYFIN